MWLLKILKKHSQKQKVHGLGIRLSINNTAKGLGGKVCLWGGGGWGGRVHYMFENKNNQNNINIKKTIY